MAMDFYLKDLYPNSGYIQTTEETVPDGHDNSEIVEDAKAAAAADNVTGNSTSGKKLAIAALVVICFAVFLGVSK